MMVPTSYCLGTRAQAEWLLQVETILTELVKIGTEDEADRDLQQAVFCPQTTNLLLDKFPLLLKKKLITAAKADTTKQRLEVYKSVMKEWSEEALEMEKYTSSTKVAPKKTPQQLQLLKDPKVNLFNPPSHFQLVLWRHKRSNKYQQT